MHIVIGPQHHRADDHSSDVPSRIKGYKAGPSCFLKQIQLRLGLVSDAQLR